MAEFEVTIDSELIQDLFLNDRGLEKLAEVVLNQLLESEMTEHLIQGTAIPFQGRTVYGGLEADRREIR